MEVEVEGACDTAGVSKASLSLPASATGITSPNVVVAKEQENASRDRNGNKPTTLTLDYGGVV